MAGAATSARASRTLSTARQADRTAASSRSMPSRGHGTASPGEARAVRGGRGEFDRARKKEAASRARSAPAGAVDSSADSCSSSSGSIGAGGVTCGHGRAAGTDVSTWEARSVPDPEHVTRARACPATSGRGGARRAPMNTPRRGAALPRASASRARGARPFMDTRRGLRRACRMCAPAVACPSRPVV